MSFRLRRRNSSFPLAGRIGLGVVVVWCLVALFGPWLAPYDPGAIVTPGTSFGPVSLEYPFGTDYLGRDMLSRVLDGARFTVGIALVATFIAVFVGTLLGMLASVSGPWFDGVLSRFMDAVFALPGTIFALVVVTGFGTSITVLVLAAAIIYIPGSYRIARALSVNIKDLDFIAVSQARGEGTSYILSREIFPNMLLPILVDFGVRFIYVVLLQSGLSFLGLGIQPPSADWGALIYENIAGLRWGAPATIFPAVAIVTLTAAVNLLVDNMPTRRVAGSEQG